MSNLPEGVVQHLQAAFTAESGNVQRYMFFAQVAEIEGHTDASKVLRELAESLAVAAQGQMDFLRDVGDPTTRLPIGVTEQNLAAALAGELEEASELYGALAREAHAEGLADLASWFETLVALKRAHVARIAHVLDALRLSTSVREPR